MRKEILRCPWAGDDPVYIGYHDNEWGIPVHEDRRLFEMLILEGFQAGLSWITILKRREGFKKAFAKWNWEKVASFGPGDKARLMSDSGIIRNRLKIEAAIGNAQCFAMICAQFGSFDSFIWKFTDNKTVRPAQPYRSLSEIPTTTQISDRMSKELRKRGFKFVGSVICYSFMQAIGMVNDHLGKCYKSRAVEEED